MAHPAGGGSNALNPASLVMFGSPWRISEPNLPGAGDRVELFVELAVPRSNAAN